MNKPVVNKRHTARRLLSYLGRGYQLRFVLVLICILITAVASVSGSLFLGTLIDNYITPLLAMETPVYDDLARVISMMAGLYVLGVVCAFLYNRLMVTISQGMQKKIRDDLFSHMQTLPIRYFDTHPHGDVMSIYTNDVDTLRQMLSQSIPQMINSMMMIVVTFVSMVALNIPLTIVVVVCIFFMLRIVKLLAGRSGRYFRRQ